MLTKLQITFCILAGVAIVVFFVAMVTNAQVKQFEPVPGWLPLVAWGSFGVTVLSSIGVIVTQILEFREKTEKKEEEKIADEATPADELAPVGATADFKTADVGTAAHIEATSESEPLVAGGLQTEIETGEGFPEANLDFDDFTTEITEFKDEE